MKTKLNKFTKRLSVSSTLAITVMVGGCAGEFFAVEGVSAALSDKTASDHVVSLLSGKECSFLRVDQGQSYCVEDAVKISQSHLYCYRTLGAATCYTEPDPRRSPSERIGYIDESTETR